MASIFFTQFLFVVVFYIMPCTTPLKTGVFSTSSAGRDCKSEKLTAMSPRGSPSIYSTSRTDLANDKIRINPRWAMKCLGVLAGVIAMGLGAARPETFYDRHVFFDNSIPVPDRSYYRSQGWAIAPSKLELVDDKFPVDTNHFMSPPNGLRLKWKSAPGGDWRIRLYSAKNYDRQNRVFEGDTISFWCFSETEMSPNESPRMTLIDKDDVGSGTIALLADYGRLPARKWVRISIPFADFKPLFQRTEDFKFDPGRLAAISLDQGFDDGKERTLYLDDFQIDYGNRAGSDPPNAPAKLAVKGAERHFDLTWTNNPESDLLSYKIYRSWDGEKYVPIGIQQGQLNRFVDFVGETEPKGFLPHQRDGFVRERVCDVKDGVGLDPAIQ